MTNSVMLPRRALLGLAAGAFATASSRPGVASELTPDALQDLVIALGTRRYPSLPPRRGGSNLEVLWGSHHLYLNNISALIRALPPEYRERAILDWLATFSPEADAKADALIKASYVWAKAEPLLRLKLFTAETVRLAKQIVHRSFTADVVEGYAIDLGDKDLYVDDGRLAAWGVSQSQVSDAASSNLEAMSKSIPVAPMRGDGMTGAFVVISTGDGYDAARILLPGFRTRLLAALGPTLLAGIPHRDLFVVWTQDFARRHGIADKVRADAMRMPHPLTGEIFAIDKDGVRLATAMELVR